VNEIPTTVTTTAVRVARKPGYEADGAIISGVVPETLKDHATSWWNRAKSGYEHAQAEHVLDIAEKDAGEIGTFSKIKSVVPGLATFRSTGNPHPSAIGILADDQVTAIPVPKPKPLPDLIKEATDDASGLIRSEVALAKSGIKKRAKIIGPALGLFFVAVFILLYAISVLIWAAVLGLGVVLPLWLSALIIGFAMILAVALLVFIGVRRLKKLGGLQFLSGTTIKDDIAAITNAFKTRNWANEQDAIKEGRL
jgi:hypothetical protein